MSSIVTHLGYLSDGISHRSGTGTYQCNPYGSTGAEGSSDVLDCLRGVLATHPKRRVDEDEVCCPGQPHHGVLEYRGPIEVLRGVQYICLDDSGVLMARLRDLEGKGGRGEATVLNHCFTEGHVHLGERVEEVVEDEGVTRDLGVHCQEGWDILFEHPPPSTCSFADHVDGALERCLLIRSAPVKQWVV